MTTAGRTSEKRLIGMVGSFSRYRRAGLAAALSAAVLLVSTACTTSGSAAAVPVDARPGSIDAGITLAALKSAAGNLGNSGKGCALPALSAAVRTAGLTPSGEPTGSTDALDPGTRFTGAAARCEVDLAGGGSLAILLVAADQASAVATTLPALARDAALPMAQIQLLADAAVKLSAGQFVDIPGTAPVSDYIVGVSGATSAALLVAGTGGPTRAQTAAVAKALAGG